MSDALDLVYRSIDDSRHADQPAATRRRRTGAPAAATLGGMGLAGLAPAIAEANDNTAENDPERRGHGRGAGDDRQHGRRGASSGRRPLDAAKHRRRGREELLHYDVLTRRRKAADQAHLGARRGVREPRDLLNTLQVGDQIFVNAYLIATSVVTWDKPDYAATAAEFMGVEAVHRALARQSLGQLGNDRVFMKYSQHENAPGAPNRGQKGFTDILSGQPSWSRLGSVSVPRGPAGLVLRVRDRLRPHAGRRGHQHPETGRQASGLALRVRDGGDAGGRPLGASHPHTTTSQLKGLNMPGFIGMPELLLLGLVCSFFGPKRLPEMGRWSARGSASSRTRSAATRRQGDGVDVSPSARGPERAPLLSGEHKKNATERTAA